MTRKFYALALSLTLVGALGCDNEEPEADAGIMLPDTGAGGDACGEPGDPYGTSEGSNFLPFTLDSCDGTPFEFYGESEGYCDSTFTVVSIAAGWCGPCRTEAQLMQSYLVDGYAAQGVRVVVAIIQDNDYRAPSTSFCEGWVNQYGLTNPVVIDPAQETSIYFPGDALPATLIVDSSGVIRHREYGVSNNLETIRAALDSLLAE